MLYLLAENPISHVVGHDLFTIHFTNQMLMTLAAAAVMLLIFPRIFAQPDPGVPTGARNFFEAIVEFLRVEVFRPALKEHTDRFVPFLWTLFFFILFCNILGLLPINALINLLTLGRAKAEIGGTATGNINNTGALAIFTFFVIHLNGIAQVAHDLVNGTYGHHEAHEEHSSSGAAHAEAAIDLEHMRGDALPADVPGEFKAVGDPTHHYKDDQNVHHKNGVLASAVHNGHAHMSWSKALPLAIPLYFWNFAPHPFRPEEGEPAWKWAMDVPMWFMLLVLEIIGAFIKPFALAIRLFANMIAGHLVLAALLTLIVATPNFLAQIGIAIPVIVLSLLISLLEVFVAFLQAYIFVFLTTLFIASAVAPEH